MGKKPYQKGKGGPKAPIQKSRKELRKEQRKVKKLKQSLGNKWSKHLAQPETSVTKSSTDKRVKATGLPKEKQVTNSIDDIRNKEKQQQKKLESDMQKSRKKLLLEANEEEDRNIRHLEKLLHLNRRKSKSLPKSFAEDGLGYLLDVCDPEKIKDSVKVDQALQDSGSDFEEDFAVVRGNKGEKMKAKSKAGSKKAKKQDAETDSNDDSGSDFGLGVDDASDEEMSDEEILDGEMSDEEISDEEMSDDEEDTRVNDNKKRKKQTEEKSSNKRGKITKDSETEESDDSDEGVSAHSSDEDMEEGDGLRGRHNKNHKKQSNTKASKNKIGSGKNTKSVSDEESDSDFGLGVDDGSEEEISDSNGDEYTSDDDMSGAEQDSDEDMPQDNSKEKEKKAGGKNSASTQEEKKKSANGEKVKFEASSASTKRKGVSSKGKKNIEEDFDDSEDDDEDDGEMGSGFGSDSTEDVGCNKNLSKRNPDGTWEDIYGRTRDKDGKVINASSTTESTTSATAGKYIPPAMRAKIQGNEDAKRKENLARLRRQIKGLINRLAENNMPSICTQMDELFMKNSRHDMNETLLSIFTDALISGVLTPERLVMEHMLLLSVLHANVGTEVGANFLQNMMKKFQELLDQSPEVENKELDNVVLILSHLYNFKIFTASLMYEVLDKIAETLDEKRIELLLIVLRSVGFSLRKDDPLALKSLILKIQGKAVDCPSASSNSSRVKFMLDILMAIKNNNVSKIPSYNPEHVEHLKKLLRSLIRRGNYVTELKISIDDLLKADERGRWWIVGSAWTGHLPGENPESNQNLEPMQSGKVAKSAESSYSTQLLDLAKKQRMNTGVRKDIFCILMTAEDYLDAFEKLLHLNLKNQQRQEIVHVLFDCCLQEKSFNPYYAHLSQKFCDFDRQYQMKFQYCLWDKLKELDQLRNAQLSNLAKLMAHLFLEKGLALSALKVMSFAEMDKPCIRLVRQILLIILLSEDASKCENVFRRIAPSSQLHLFREGLRLFIRHFVLRKSKNGALPQDDLELLEERAKIADRALSSVDARLEF